jgi:hypothetical protein
MDQVRCPYCIDGDGSKVMDPRDDHLVCECGHKAAPNRPNYRCSCPKCIELRDAIEIPARW